MTRANIVSTGVDHREKGGVSMSRSQLGRQLVERDSHAVLMDKDGATAEAPTSIPIPAPAWAAA
jgi:hypothetical protein